MNIIDSNGNVIEIDDLPKAIEQIEEFINYRHEDSSLQKPDERLHEYWTDLYSKIRKLII